MSVLLSVLGLNRVGEMEREREAGLTHPVCTVKLPQPAFTSTNIDHGGRCFSMIDNHRKGALVSYSGNRRVIEKNMEHKMRGKAIISRGITTCL